MFMAHNSAFNLPCGRSAVMASSQPQGLALDLCQVFALAALRITINKACSGPPSLHPIPHPPLLYPPQPQPPPSLRRGSKGEMSHMERFRNSTYQGGVGVEGGVRGGGRGREGEGGRERAGGRAGPQAAAAVLISYFRYQWDPVG